MIITEPTTINETIQLYITPHEMSDLDQSIYNKIACLLNTCDKKYGYVLDILKIQHNKDIKIHHNGNCITQVNISLKNIIPKPNDVYYMSINSIYNEDETAIFVKYGLMNILIYNLDDWNLKEEYTNITGERYQYNTGHLNSVQYIQHKTSGEQYYISDWVYVRITAVQYDHNQYQCIGEIVIE